MTNNNMSDSAVLEKGSLASVPAPSSASAEEKLRDNATDIAVWLMQTRYNGNILPRLEDLANAIASGKTPLELSYDQAQAGIDLLKRDKSYVFTIAGYST